MPQPGHSLMNDLSGGFVPSLCLLVLASYGTATLAQDVLEESATTETGDTDTAAEESAGEMKDESKRGNFLVLPIFITEPAIGEGLGVGVVYFHKKDESDKPRVSTANAMGKTGISGQNRGHLRD